MFSRKSLHILYEFEIVHTDKGTGYSVVNSSVFSDKYESNKCL